MSALLHPILLFTAFYAVLGVILFGIERCSVGDEADVQAINIVLISTGCFAYNVSSLSMLRKLQRSHSKLITTFYLANNVVRLLLAIIVLLVYALCFKDSLLLFSINLIAYYILTMVLTGYYHIKTEHIKKAKKKNETSQEPA